MEPRIVEDGLIIRFNLTVCASTSCGAVTWQEEVRFPDGLHRKLGAAMRGKTAGDKITMPLKRRPHDAAMVTNTALIPADQLPTRIHEGDLVTSKSAGKDVVATVAQISNGIATLDLIYPFTGIGDKEYELEILSVREPLDEELKSFRPSKTLISHETKL